MEVTFTMLLTVCPLVFLAATVDAIGGGGGLISLPAYLLTGLPPAVASGTNKLSACMGTLAATGKFAKSGRLQLAPALCAVAGALPGAYIGAEVLKRADENFVRIFLLIAVPIVAVLLLLKRDTQTTPRPLTKARLFACSLLGLGCGFYDGFFGPGTGTLLIMGLTFLIGMDMVTASGSAKLINLASNVAALTAMIVGGKVLFKLAIPAGCFAIAGGYLGSFLAIKRGAKCIRYVMLGVMALILIKLAIDWIA